MSPYPKLHTNVIYVKTAGYRIFIAISADQTISLCWWKHDIYWVQGIFFRICFALSQLMFEITPDVLLSLLNRLKCHEYPNISFYNALKWVRSRMNIVYLYTSDWVILQPFSFTICRLTNVESDFMNVWHI